MANTRNPMEAVPRSAGVLRRVVRPIATAGLLLAVVAAIGFRWTRSPNPSQVLESTRMICTDSDCGRTFSVKLRAGDQPRCPACQAAAVPAFPCSHCGKAIVLNAYLHRAGPTVCPHCHQEIPDADAE